jgi:5-enolpyruvylshikimate-3-phosphate synthase
MLSTDSREGTLPRCLGQTRLSKSYIFVAVSVSSSYLKTLLFSQTLVSSNGRTVDESTAKHTQGAVAAEELRSKGPQQHQENSWLHLFGSTEHKEDIGIWTEI